MGSLNDEWLVEGSIESKRIVNPIRDIVDGRKLEQNPKKDLISLSLGQCCGLNIHYSIKCCREPTIYLACLLPKVNN